MPREYHFEILNQSLREIFNIAVKPKRDYTQYQYLRQTWLLRSLEQNELYSAYLFSNFVVIHRAQINMRCCRFAIANELIVDEKVKAWQILTTMVCSFQLLIIT